MMPPQPSPTKPQVAPACMQVRGVQLVEPHCPATPPAPQDWPAAQVPQFSVPPQPSPVVPQPTLSVAQLIGVQLPPPEPHRNAVPPPPQDWPATAQVPQLTVPPQPSPTSPQVAFTIAQ